MVNIGHIFVWALLLAITSGTDLSGDDNLNNVLSEFDSSSRLIRDTSLSAKNIEKIDVKCDQGNGMLVEIEFSEDFEGVIYSQGYFNDPQCNYVKGEKTGRSFVFSVPYNACGSKPACSVCASVENILIIQNDRDIQNNFDIARKISCSRGDEREKTVYFKPFVVDMLEVISVDTPSGPVKCWMEIGTGAPPNIKPISGSLSLGDDITFTINVEHSEQPWDVNILQCYASDDMDFEGRTTKRLQLSDNRGCSIKKKIFGEWRRYKGPSSLTSTYYNTLKAFRFPDRSQVYLKCDIELCNGACQRDNSCDDSKNLYCPEDLTDPRRDPACSGSKNLFCPEDLTDPRRDPSCGDSRTISCPEDSTDPLCLQNHLKNTTPKPRCFPGATDSRCPRVTTQPPVSARTVPTLRPTYTPLIPRKPETTSKTNCIQGSTDIDCLNCFPGSPDPRCPKIPTTKRAGCSEGSDDIKCQPATYLPPSTRRVSIPTKPTTPITYAPPTSRTQITTARPDCFPGATDSRCPRVTTQSPVSARTTISSFRPSFTPPTPRISITTSKAQSSTYLPPVSARTVPTPRPTFTPLIPRKPETTSKTNCIQGSTDIDCLNCFPGSPDPRCPKIPTTKRAGCSEGSDDIKCQPATYLPPSTRRVSIPTKPTTPITYAPPTSRTQITTARPDCFPGATDSRCPRVTTQSPVSARTTISSFRPSFTPPTPRISITTSKAQSSTYLPPVSARTVPTPRPTFTPLIPRKPETTSKTNCIQGSTDIDCLNCFPGSPDPRCPKIPTTKRAGCSEGSDDIKCQPATYLPPSTRRVSIPTKPATPITYAPPTPRTQITTARPDCFPGATDSRCPRVTTQSPVSARTTISSFRPSFTPPTPRISITTSKAQSSTYLPPVSARTVPTLRPTYTPLIPRKPETTSKTNCIQGSTDIDCLNCFPGSPDPRCPKIPTTKRAGCSEGSDDIKCQPATYLPPSTRRVSIPTKPATPITYAPPTPRTQITTARPDCFPGATDSRCPRVTTQSPVSARTTISSFRPSFTPPTPRISITTSKAQSSTYLPPVSARTVPTLRPTYTPLIPRKPETTSKTNCIQGSTDIDCLNCFPGSPDPRCPKIPTTKRAGCSEGSDDIKCQPATYLPPSTRRVSIPTKPTTPITYAPPTSRTQITTARPDCFPGATDSRCPRVTTQSPVSARTTIPSFRPTFTPYTQRTSITTTRTLIDATTPIYCYPGSIDPRCPDSGYRGTSRIPATYLPPLSDTGYDRTIRNAKTSFFKEINHLAFSDNNVFELDDDENEPSRVKRELRSDDQELDHNEDLLSRKIVKRETNERPSEQEVISLTLGVRMGISVK
ncbi:mucin-2 [Drosophila kikkawai]|uniref:Mucin-2 n=1 Tax=Drosophila kikkawai TaxID=30033 RepID=A0ABM4GEJ8_DROKI